MTDAELSARVAREVFGEDPCSCPRTEVAPSGDRHPLGPFDTRDRGRHLACGKLPCSIRAPFRAEDAERVWDCLVGQGSVSIRRSEGEAAVSVLTDRVGTDLWEPDWKRALFLVALQVAEAEAADAPQET